jgi:hypothetical protein
MLIFQILELSGVGARAMGFQEVFRPQQTADLVGSVFEGHGLLF